MRAAASGRREGRDDVVGVHVRDSSMSRLHGTGRLDSTRAGRREGPAMSLRRALIVLVVAGLCALVLSLVRQAGGPRWRGLREGMDFATLRGDPYCRRGSSEIAVLRFDPARV